MPSAAAGRNVIRPNEEPYFLRRLVTSIGLVSRVLSSEVCEGHSFSASDQPIPATGNEPSESPVLTDHLSRADDSTDTASVGVDAIAIADMDMHTDKDSDAHRRTDGGK